MTGASDGPRETAGRCLIVDAVAYQERPQGGIVRVYDEILPRLCDRDPGLSIVLLACGRLRRQPPARAAIRLVRVPPLHAALKPGAWWARAREAVRARMLGRAVRGLDGIWHSTHYTLAAGWMGPVLMPVFDLIQERYPPRRPDAWARALLARKQAAIRRADRVLCISEATRAGVRECYGLPDAKLAVLPLGCSPVFRPPAGGEASARPYLLYVGPRGGYKNFATFLDAYAGWPRRREVDVVLVGGGEWRAAERARLAAAGAEGAVRRVAAATDGELARLYAGASGFVYPSLCEGFGLPVIEAMACGCPVAASRIPTTVEAAGDSPYYFAAESVDECRAALDAMLAAGRGAPRVRMGLARAAAWSWETAAGRFLDACGGLHARGWRTA